LQSGDSAFGRHGLVDGSAERPGPGRRSKRSPGEQS
jgi:hypothetical protein